MTPHAVRDFRNLPDLRIKSLVASGFFQQIDRPISQTPNILLANPTDDFKIGKSHLHKRLWRTKEWTSDGVTNEAKFFILDDGTKVSVKRARHSINIKPDMSGRDYTITLDCHHPLRIYAELLRSKVLMEHVRGAIYTNDPEQPILYVSKFVEGEMLASRGPCLTADEKMEVARNMGKRLAKIHSKGVVHCHPHSGNWIVTPGLNARLIDQKLVHFAEDFPLSSNDRMLSFEFMKVLDKYITFQAAKECLGERYLPYIRVEYNLNYQEYQTE